MVLSLMAVTSMIGILLRINASLLVEIPARGGAITEGVIGNPRLINPILAESDVDRDLSALVFAGILRRTDTGILAPELAETYSISADGTAYRVTLRNDATFHDGTPVTASDVAFTIERIQDPGVESPYRADFSGVSVQVIDPQTIEFTLPAPYAPFIENLTVGILPQHIWARAQPQEMEYSQFNVEPIGAGPYVIETIDRDDSGMASAIHLAAFSDYVRGEPNISRYTVVFFRAEPALIEALRSGTITAASGIPAYLAREFADAKTLTTHHAPLPRVFGLFYNTNRAPVFAKREVREALDVLIDRNALISQALAGYGVAITSATMATSALPAKDPAQLLTDAGWQRNDAGVWQKKEKTGTTELSFAIATADIPELVRAGESLVAQLTQFGASVELTVLPSVDLAQTVIRPRKFDVLLFGQVVGRETDVYPFWHSSQRNDPGLNIAMYTNIDADAALETLRESTDPKKRAEALGVFEREMRTDRPAAFLFMPELVIILPSEVQNVTLSGVVDAADRFATIAQWYIQTDSVWPWFQ
jgi:peptide/nickel transport system substrate-binding protein